MKISLQKEHAVFLETLKWDLKIREQAVRVAEYLALVRSINNSTNPTDSDFQKANQLSWELAMWLPETVYRRMTYAMVNPGPDGNELTTVVEVRSLLLGRKAGRLTSEDIAHHGRGIGKQTAPSLVASTGNKTATSIPYSCLPGGRSSFL